VTAPEFAPGGIPPGAKPHEVALACLGVHEIPGRPNRGPLIDECLRFVNLEPDSPNAPTGGYAWCCAFGVWCAWKGGIKLPRLAGVVSLSRMIAGRRIAVPEPGCVILHIDPGGQRGHFLFFLHHLLNGDMATVSGNTSDTGSREGTKVAIVSHPAHYATDNGGGFYHMRPLTYPELVG